MDVDDNVKEFLRICSIACVWLLIAGYVIFFIFACISLTKTNVDAVYAVCGHSLRDIVLVDVLFASIVLVLYVSVVAIVGDCVHFRWFPRKKTEEIGLVAFSIAAVLYGAVLLILGSFSIKEFADASKMQGCIEVLSDTTGGMKSLSANLGEPLLAKIALLFGIFYIVGGIVAMIWGLINVCLKFFG
jgi:hypothetical protein